MTLENAASVVAAGAHGVAVSSALVDAPEPEAAARELVKQVNEAAKSEELERT